MPNEQEQRYQNMRMNGLSPSGFSIPEPEPTEEMCDWRKRENGLLCDIDPMPFGKHKGEPMQDVPASYLHWLWVNGKKDDHKCKVADYIRRNLNALKLEHRDGLWA